MEISSQVIASMKLLNSGVIENDFLQEILMNVRNTLIPTSSSSADANEDNNTYSGETAIIYNTLKFAISSLLLETAKYNSNIDELTKALKHNEIDVQTEYMQAIITFVDTNLLQVVENLSQTELAPEPQFKSLSWSQKIDIKSSNIDNIRERSFVLDFSHQNAPNNDEHFELEVSAKELNDLYSSIRDCTRNIERLLNKN